MSLGEIESLVERGELRQALELALATWRKSRQPALADLVESLADALATPPFAPLNAEARVFQARWLEALAQDPVAHLSYAMRTLARGVPQEPVESTWGEGVSERRYAAWLARLRALDGLPDDPRLAAGCVDVLRRMPWLDGVTASAFPKLYRPLLDRLRRLRDVRQIAVLQELAAHSVSRSAFNRDFHAEEFPPLAASLASVEVPPLPEVEAGRLAALRRRLGPAPPPPAPGPSAHEAALLAMVVANPDDDAPREVLADAWSDRGDARGEFVALHLRLSRGQATPAEERHLRSLLFRHEASWLGALHQVSKHRQYQRGFLDVFELQQNHFASEARWAEALAAPGLGTVTVIHQGKCNRLRYRAFTLAAPNLRSIEVVTRAMLLELSERPPPRLEHLRLEFALDRKVAAQLRAFPRLASLLVPTASPERDRDLAASLLGHISRIELKGPDGTKVLRALGPVPGSER